MLEKGVYLKGGQRSKQEDTRSTQGGTHTAFLQALSETEFEEVIAGGPCGPGQEQSLNVIVRETNDEFAQEETFQVCSTECTGHYERQPVRMPRLNRANSRGSSKASACQGQQASQLLSTDELLGSEVMSMYGMQQGQQGQQEVSRVNRGQRRSREARRPAVGSDAAPLEGTVEEVIFDDENDAVYCVIVLPPMIRITNLVAGVRRECGRRVSSPDRRSGRKAKLGLGQRAGQANSAEHRPQPTAAGATLIPLT